MTGPAQWSGAGDIAAVHHAALSRSQAAELGLTARQLAQLVARGVLLPAGPPNVFTIAGAPATWQQRLAVATLSTPASVVSHQAAGQLHRLEICTNDVVSITVKRGQHVRCPGVVVHRVSVPVPSSDILKIDGLPCTSLARTVVDLAAVVDRHQLVRMCDEFERRGYSTIWLKQVAERLRRPGQCGTKAILAHLAERAKQGSVAESWFERLMAEILCSKVLPTLEPQYSLRDNDGTFIARFDLAIPSVRLGIEMHSRAFHTGIHQEIVDQRRENRALLLGWQMLYFGWADRKTPGEACRYLEQLYQRRLLDLAATK